MISLSLHKKLHTAQGNMVLDIELKITPGEFITLYGESGAGKTSTLRMLAGLLTPDKGKITVDNEAWLDTQQKIDLPPQKREIGFVFQEYALFPNMTVRKNLDYALQKTQDKKIIEELIDMIELGDLQYQKPNTLSGGQQQRVALARALVQKPKILLLDEPLSALDAKMRMKLQGYLLNIQKKYNITILLVSHDIPEIIKLSDRVYVLEKGNIVNSGIPSQIFGTNHNHETFQCFGEVIDILIKENQVIVSVLIGTTLIKIPLKDTEMKNIGIGDKISITSASFDPIITKVDL